MVTDARIHDLKRKLVKGHKITLQEWVNKTDKDICRYLVLDDILQYHEIPSSAPRYEIFNCSTYGFFDKIEDAEKKYNDIISKNANGRYLINDILPKDYHTYASYNRKYNAGDEFIKKYNVDPVYLCNYVITQAIPTIMTTHNNKIKKGE